MKIRTIEPKDNQAMKQILQNDLKTVGLDLPGTAYFDSNLDTLNQFYDENDKRIYYVIVDDQDIVHGGAGCAEFDLENGIAELQKLYFDKTVRGQGLSYQIITMVEDFARKAGYQKLYLETHHKLATAIHVYQKMNFQKIVNLDEGMSHPTSDESYIKTL